jgi:hypothetical protein
MQVSGRGIYSGLKKAWFSTSTEFWMPFMAQRYQGSLLCNSLGFASLTQVGSFCSSYHIFIHNEVKKLGMVTYSCNPSIWEAEAEGSRV